MGILKLNRRGTIILAFGVLCLLLAFGGISKAMIDYTSRPVFCGGCHLMQTRYISFSRSIHNKAICMDCHTEPGFIGEMKGHINGVKYLYYAYKGYRTASIIRAKVENESCLVCHTIDQMDRNIGMFASLVQETSHKSHIYDLKLSCTNCHGNIMHVRLDGTSEKTVFQHCKDCHKQTDFVARPDYYRGKYGRTMKEIAPTDKFIRDLSGYRVEP